MAPTTEPMSTNGVTKLNKRSPQKRTDLSGSQISESFVVCAAPPTWRTSHAIESTHTVTESV